MTRPRSSRSDRFSAVVLAAGMSQRMGGPNKLLLPIAGAPLVRRSIETLCRHHFVEVIAVTGRDAPAIEKAIQGLPIRVVRNPAYQDGQMTSVRAGLEALQEPSRGVFVALADQPWLTPEDVALIAQAFSDRPDCRVLVPTFRGARGNPIVLSRASLSSILARSGNFGCRQFVAKNPDLVTTVEMPSDHVIRDLDVPADYCALVLDQDGVAQ